MSRFLVVGVLAAACSSDGGTTPVDSAEPTIAATTAVAGAIGEPSPLAAFETGTIRLGGRLWTVALATTPDLRSQGLRGVADLDGLDGMLFVFGEETTTAFTMRGTLMAIDIAFFTAEGRFVDVIEMVPCAEEPCPSYRASGSFRYAVETARSGFRGIDLVLDPLGN